MNKIESIRCSGLSRPMKCAGYLFMENTLPQETSSAAEEGTAAMELLEAMITQRRATDPIVKPQASNGVTFDSDMYFYMSGLAKVILGLRALNSNEILCETQIDWMTSSGIMIKGRYDISYVNGDTLHIDDLKYGYGIVEPEENWQLLGYTIGEIKRRGKQFPFYCLTIHQPRAHHEKGPMREWRITHEQLMYYWQNIENRMSAIKSGFKELATGTQCKYCPAAAQCPALSRSVFQGLDTIMDTFKEDNLSNRQISYQMDLLSKALELTKIKQDSLNQLAVQRIKDGQLIPHYMNEESYGDRKWKKDISPEVIETLTGIKITETVMLSPAKAEKAGVSKELVKNMVTREFKGMKMVRKDSGSLADKIFNS